MRYRLAVLLGRCARWLLRLRGGGSAVPGRVALALAPDFVARALSRLPHGIVFVSGSNGKSTTTNMLTAVLREHGLEVFTNPAGGNLPQGVASALLATVGADGYVRADIGVVEVDEAYGVGLAASLRPRVVLLLNVQVDQLNRFYEPSRVAGMLRRIADDATELVVVNADDGHLAALGAERQAAGASVTSFGVAPELIAGAPHGLANADDFADAAAPVPPPPVVVTALGGREATIDVAGERFAVVLPARGLHYAVDAAGAIATARAVLGERFDGAAAQRAFAGLRTVYGRGEVLEYRGQRLELIMMKNPPSLQLNLDYLERVPERVLWAVDEGTPDPSWFWGTDVSNIARVDVVTGDRAWQIATRLAYAEIPVDLVEPRLDAALERFLALPAPETGAKTLVVNYEQMMLIRKALGFLDLEGGDG